MVFSSNINEDFSISSKYFENCSCNYSVILIIIIKNEELRIQKRIHLFKEIYSHFQSYGLKVSFRYPLGFGLL